jgi:hypothetical protein
MKRPIIICTASVALLFTLTECAKDNKSFNAHFYATFSRADGPLTLYIDDQLKGDLPYISVAPTCENDSLKQKMLRIVLKSGKYKVVAKSKDGGVKSSGTITLKTNKTGASGGVGGQQVMVVGDCTFVGMME